MQHYYHISGQSQSWISLVVRYALFIFSVVAGLFILFFAAAFVLMLLAGLAGLGLFIGFVLWLKAKITGKPFGPHAQFEQMRKDMEQGKRPDFSYMQFKSRSFKSSSSKSSQDRGNAHTSKDGPILDAQQTPKGWSVDH